MIYRNVLGFTFDVDDYMWKVDRRGIFIFSAAAKDQCFRGGVVTWLVFGELFSKRVPLFTNKK